MTGEAQTATFGAGCFWGLDTAFRRLAGVLKTSVGFMGGRTATPTYGQVSIGNTGHAEVVQVIYDPDQITYDDLLNYFWTLHDPTTWAKPNPDVASQYRSVIFYHSEDQKAIALASRAKREKSKKINIATTIEPAKAYTPADKSHQNYEQKNGFS